MDHEEATGREGAWISFALLGYYLEVSNPASPAVQSLYFLIDLFKFFR